MATFRFAQRLAELCLIVSLAALSSAQAAETGSAKRVLIISTGSRFSAGFAAAHERVLEALGKISAVRLETYGEDLDIIRFPTARFQRLFGEYLQEKYADQRPDLVMLLYVIVAGLTEEEVRPNEFGRRISGIAQRLDPRASIELILRLQPETRRIVVIGGTAEVDRSVIERVKEAASSFAGRVEFDFWDNRAVAELHQAVSTLPAKTAILFSRMFRDGAGHAYVSSQVGKWIAQWSNAPVYVMADSILGTGAVGGSLVTIDSLGKRAGELAGQILTGTPPASLPFEIRTDSAPVLDWRALKRWGISETRLPTGSVVKYRPLSMWDQYRWYIAGTLTIIAIQAMLIFGLMLQRTRRRRAERDVGRQRQELAHAGRVSMMGQLATALAHELNQPLGAILRNAEAGELFAQANPPDLKEIREILSDIRKDDQRAGEVIDRMRALLKRQESQWSRIDLNQLAEEVVRLVRSDAERRKVKLVMDLAPAQLAIAGDRVQLQQVLLNLVLNAMDAMNGSAGAERRVSIRTCLDDGRAQVAVSDLGHGIPKENLKRLFEPFFTTKPSGMGMGLAISQTIIGVHGGSITAENNSDGGATFTVTLKTRDEGRGAI
jgi:signal transduction histidine kinase